MVKKEPELEGDDGDKEVRRDGGRREEGAICVVAVLRRRQTRPLLWWWSRRTTEKKGRGVHSFLFNGVCFLVLLLQ